MSAPSSPGSPSPGPSVVTLTLNPALDLTVQADGWRRGQVNSAQAYQQDAGGKGVNVASFLADWGLSVTVTGLLGAGNPEAFEALFQAKHMHDAFVRVPGLTRVGIKLADGAAQETTDINLPGLAATRGRWPRWTPASPP
ncbi:PfkB family carbohydrate kinase [Deinococcus radiopugnans]|uniref:PfkB family carbohydrate kinase n=1 Tax=Deinococcus radiopugnans TaxID=57497 RepID=UPI00361F67BF